MEQFGGFYVQLYIAKFGSDFVLQAQTHTGFA